MPAVFRIIWLRTRRVFLHYRIPVRAETEKELFYGYGCSIIKSKGRYAFAPDCQTTFVCDKRESLLRIYHRKV